jgi:hypothetical protein
MEESILKACGYRNERSGLVARSAKVDLLLANPRGDNGAGDGQAAGCVVFLVVVREVNDVLAAEARDAGPGCSRSSRSSRGSARPSSAVHISERGSYCARNVIVFFCI